MKRAWKEHKIGKDHEVLHPYSINLAWRLNHYRKIHRLTQVDLSARVGIPQSVISTFESGWANPSLGNLVKLAKFFKIPVCVLIAKLPKPKDG